MTDRMVLTEDEAYELLAHLVASAEICTFEPYYYGSFRLIDAASRLMGHVLARGDPERDGWLRDLKQEIDRKKVWMMWDREGYFQFLGEVARPLAERLAARDREREAPGRGAAAGR
jgi:hypothetical protein